MAELEYRSGFDERVRRRVVRELRLAVGVNWGKVVGGLVVGAILTMIFAAVVGAIVSAIVGRIWPAGPGRLIFLGAAMGASAWGFWTAWRRSGNPMEDELWGFAGRSSSYGEYNMRSMTATLYLYAELLLWGPKMMVEAIELWRGGGMAGGVAMERAADVVLMLGRMGGGAEVRELMLAGDSERGMKRVIGFLRDVGWVDCGMGEARVWLTESGRLGSTKDAIEGV